VTSIACLMNPRSPAFTEPETNELVDAARALGLRLQFLTAGNANEVEAAFSILVRERAGGLLVSAETYFVRNSYQIVALAARNAVPTIYPFREHAVAGGLMSYGTDLPGAYRPAGLYAGRILKGEKPADLPVQQVTKMQLAINMKTAKTLGLT